MPQRTPLRNRLLYPLLMASAVLPSAIPVHGQIATDGSLGEARNLSGPDFVIPAHLGTTNAGNLFHSFTHFNLADSESATFTAPPEATLDNIFSRVTGGSPSSINGLLRSAVPGADLWLINPAGIMFGPGAQLDLPAGFHSGTADYVIFEDNRRFFAEASELTVNSLSAAAPRAFGFLGSPVGEIRVDATTLSATTLEMAAGKLALRASELRGDSIRLAAREIELKQQSSIGVDVTNEASPGASHQLTLTADEVLLSGGSEVFTRTERLTGLDVEISADRLSLSEQSIIYTATEGSGNSGNINISGAGGLPSRAISLAGGYVDSDSLSVAEDAGRSGDINLTGRSLSVTENGRINTFASSARSGDINLRVNQLDVENPLITDDMGNISVHRAIYSTARGNGDAGNIAISGLPRPAEPAILTPASRVSIIGSTIDADSTATGEEAGGAGAISVYTRSLGISNHAFLSADTLDGSGGFVRVYADQISVADNGSISSLTAGSGDSGGVSISGLREGDTPDATPASAIAVNTGGSISVNSTSIENDAGSAGVMQIVANRLLLTEDGLINADTVNGENGGIVMLVDNLFVSNAGIRLSSSGKGNASQLFILGSGTVVDPEIIPQAAAEVVLGPGSRLESVSTATGDSAGTAGGIFVVADSLSTEGAIISATTNDGEGGQISLDADIIRLLNDTRINTSTEGNGRAGTISLEQRRDAQFVEVASSAIVSDSTGPGDAGNLVVRSGDFSAVFSTLSTSSQSTGKAGSIIVEGHRISLSDSTISVSADASAGGDLQLGSGEEFTATRAYILATTRADQPSQQGGNIVIAQPELMILDRSVLDANANAGAGGNIDIRAGTLVRSADTLITATSESSIDGQIAIEAVDDLNARVLEVKAPQAREPAAIDKDCNRQIPTQNSTLTVESARQDVGRLYISRERILSPSD